MSAIALMYFLRKVRAASMPNPSDLPEKASCCVLGEVLPPVHSLVVLVEMVQENMLCC